MKYRDMTDGRKFFINIARYCADAQYKHISENALRWTVFSFMGRLRVRLTYLGHVFARNFSPFIFPLRKSVANCVFRGISGGRRSIWMARRCPFPIAQLRGVAGLSPFIFLSPRPRRSQLSVKRRRKTVSGNINCIAQAQRRPCMQSNVPYISNRTDPVWRCHARAVEYVFR